MKNTEKQLRDLQTTRMTDAERLSLRTHLINHMERTSPSHYNKIPSPFHNFWNPVLVTMASFVFIIFGGSAVAYNASSSLPGDLLYGFKVHVSEEVRGIFIKSPLEKINFEQYRLAKRISEVKDLATVGKLTAENVAIAEKNIDTHIAKIDESAKALAETDPKEFVEAAKGLEPILDAHEKEAAVAKTIEVEQNKQQEKVAPVETIILPENTTSIINTDIVKNPNTTLPTVDPVVTKTEEKAPLIQKIEDQVVDSLILKVEKESKILQEIAKPIVDKKEVKDSSVKIEAPKEIVPTAIKPIQ